jgi:hypothetical protein
MCLRKRPDEHQRCNLARAKVAADPEAALLYPKGRRQRLPFGFRDPGWLAAHQVDRADGGSIVEVLLHQCLQGTSGGLLG